MNDETERLRRERDQYARSLAELTDRFSQKVEELSLVRQVGDALGASLDLPTVCGRTVDLLQEALSPENCSVMLMRPDGSLVTVAARGAFDENARTYEPSARTPTFAIGEGIAGIAAQSRKVIRLGDATLDPRFKRRPGAVVRPRSLVSIPLASRDQVIGVINLSDSVPDAFEPRHERVLAIIGNAVAIAVENARLFSELSRSREALANENQSLKRQLSDRFSFGGLVGTSPAFRSVLQLAEKVSNTSASVLITGDSGTGKELIAKTLHHNSERSGGPFVAINCAALPESLLEAELFGIERGVATGVDARPGTFERASGGTLFLDEIGDMAVSVQAKLLRVIQERQVVRVGGMKPTAVDVRLVAATHRALGEEIAAGRFREDLFYRLKVVTISLPPLRERRADIVPLAEFFLARFMARHQRPDKVLSQAAVRAILAHPWPGNVRQLEHAIEQAVLVADGDEIEVEDLGLEVALPSGIRVEIPETIADLPTIMDEVQAMVERTVIGRALSEAGGNRTRAAENLGLARRTLLYKLQKLGL